MVTLKQTLNRTREWSINRLESVVPIGDKHAIYKEFEEWIEVEPDNEDLEVLFLENLSEYYKDEGVDK